MRYLTWADRETDDVADDASDAQVRNPSDVL